MLMFDLALLVPAAAVALGALFAVKAVALRRQGRACAGWPTVAGKIIGSRVDTAIIDNITETDARGRVRPDEQVSASAVRYAHRVGDRDYQSTRLYLWSLRSASAAWGC